MANSRLGESLSDLCRAKIKLGEFKALYSSSVLDCEYPDRYVLVICCLSADVHNMFLQGVCIKSLLYGGGWMES